MTNPALGTKRSCPQCKANYYDLNKSPAICPKCTHQFDPASLVRSKKKAVRRSAEDEAAIRKAAAKKDELQKKKKSSDDGDVDGHDIEEMEDMDSMDDVDELNKLEEDEDEQLAEDDADEEAIIEELDTGGKTLVDNIEEEEAQALVDEIEDERNESRKPAKPKK